MCNFGLRSWCLLWRICLAEWFIKSSHLKMLLLLVLKIVIPMINFFVIVPMLCRSTLAGNVPALGEVAKFGTDYFLLNYKFLAKRKTLILPQNSQSRQTHVGGSFYFFAITIVFSDLSSVSKYISLYDSILHLRVPIQNL